MGPAYYIMAILGCGDAGMQCEQVRIVPAHYVSQDACFAAAPDLLGASDDLAFPVVMTECRAVSAAQAAADRAQNPEG